LFGHSLGALVAFELARRWTDEHRDVRGLIVSGAAAPQYPRTKSPLHGLSDAALRRELDQLGGTPGEVQANDELFLLFVPTLRADLEVLETYQFRAGPPLPIPLLIAGGTVDGWANADQLLDWSKLSSRPCAVRWYVGGHFFILDERERVLAEVQQFLAAQNLTAPDTQVWRFDLDQPGDESLLSEVEKARAARFIKSVIRRRFISSRTQLRQVLGTALSVAPHEVVLKISDYGKPHLDPAIHPIDLRFNLSHSENVGLLAVTTGHEVGVDVEQIRPEIATGDLARRYFSSAEVAALESLPECRRVARFFDYWSAKEAYIKARGQGLHIPLDEFDVPLDASAGSLPVLDRHDPNQSGRWHVALLNVASGFAAALCTPHRTATIALHR
jgi:4'-phosphopantetheinyl transferase